MRTFLLTWNPNKWEWTSVKDLIVEINQLGSAEMRWSCGGNKSIEPGDRLFLLRLGIEPKGIIASGFAKSRVSADQHWSGEDGKTANYILMEFDALVDPSTHSILSLERLETEFPDQSWTPQMSGISINSEYVDQIEKIWFHMLSDIELEINYSVKRSKGDEEAEYWEGNPYISILARYERNPYAKKRCLEYHGFKCKICEFDFESVYGNIGTNYIHVHHLTPMAANRMAYKIDPIKDLLPVCPNCHSMLHKKTPPLDPHELQKIMRNRNRG